MALRIAKSTRATKTTPAAPSICADFSIDTPAHTHENVARDMASNMRAIHSARDTRLESANMWCLAVSEFSGYLKETHLPQGGVPDPDVE